jgi:hypothetical protein
VVVRVCEMARGEGKSAASGRFMRLWKHAALALVLSAIIAPLSLADPLEDVFGAAKPFHREKP